MSVLAALRYLQAEVTLGPNGAPIVRNVSPEWLEKARGEKAEITAILKAEVFDGIRYEDSALFWQIEYMGRALDDYSEEHPARQRFQQIVSEIDTVARESLDDARELIAAHRSEVWRLIAVLDDQQYLEGEALAAQVRECFPVTARGSTPAAVASSSDVKDTIAAPSNTDLFAAPTPMVDVSAFD